MVVRVILAMFAIALAAHAVARDDGAALTAQETAAAFYSAAVIEREAPTMAGTFAALGNRYNLELRKLADALGGTRKAVRASLPCPFGGTIDVVGTPGIFYVLRADYRDCVSRSPDGETTRSGHVEVGLLNLASSAQRLVSVNFGRSGVAFAEQHRTFGTNSSTPPARLLLDFSAEGEFLERDESGEPIAGAYSLVIDGSLSDERYASAPRGKVLNATIVDADALNVSGNARFVERLSNAEPTTFFVTTTRLASGTLTHDLYRQGSTPEFVRKQWTFDELVLITADNTLSKEQLHSVNGGVRINLPESATAGCMSGLLELQTVDTILESTRASKAFGAGAIRINNSSRISFLGNDVEIKSGEQSISLASGAKLFEFGRCAY